MTDLESFTEFVHEELSEYYPDWEPPTYRIVCPQCDGRGTSTAYLGAYTQSDRDEMGDEWYEFADDIRRGMYDRTCETCNGRNVIDQLDDSAMPSDLLAAWVSWVTDMHQLRQIEAMERRMGA